MVINSSAIAWVGSRVYDSKYKICCYEDYVQDANYTQEEIIKFLRQVTMKNSFKEASIAIPSLQVIRKTYDFSLELNEADIKTDIIERQKRYFGEIKDELVIDFVITKSINEKAHTRQVYLFAAKKLAISWRNAFLKKAGLVAIKMEPDSYALLRVLYKTEKIYLTLRQAGVFVNLGKKFLRVIIFNHLEVMVDQFIDLEMQEPTTFLQQILQYFTLNYGDYVIKQSYIVGNGEKSVLEKFLKNSKIPFCYIRPFDNFNLDIQNENNLLAALGAMLWVGDD